VLLSKAGRQYRRHIAGLLLQVGYKPLGEARIGIYIEARPPDNRRRDLDNLNKAMLDALQKANLYDDDSQIDDLQLVRGPIIQGGRIGLQIWEQACRAIR
jgi:crossover junction endodeoxyribonuclease RusA